MSIVVQTLTDNKVPKDKERNGEEGEEGGKKGKERKIKEKKKGKKWKLSCNEIIFKEIYMYICIYVYMYIHIYINLYIWNLKHILNLDIIIIIEKIFYSKVNTYNINLLVNILVFILFFIIIVK